MGSPFDSVQLPKPVISWFINQLKKSGGPHPVLVIEINRSPTLASGATRPGPEEFFVWNSDDEVGLVERQIGTETLSDGWLMK